MDRRDEGLAFLLRYENVAWYESGTVRILDRRIYPVRIEFVTCHTHGEVAQAIADMVTQSGGPYTAAAMGMALAAWAFSVQIFLSMESLPSADRRCRPDGIGRALSSSVPVSRASPR